jgi:hypothetical protein
MSQLCVPFLLQGLWLMGKDYFGTFMDVTIISMHAQDYPPCPVLVGMADPSLASLLRACEDDKSDAAFQQQDGQILALAPTTTTMTAPMGGQLVTVHNLGKS